MKKTLFYVLILLNGFSFGQNCTPDPTVIDTTGVLVIRPDTLVCFPNCYAFDIVTIIAPDTVTIFPFGLKTLDHMTIKTITKPSWLNYHCQDSTCEYYPGNPKCICIWGTPPSTSGGQTFSINILVDLYGNDSGSVQLIATDTIIANTIPVIVEPLSPCDIGIKEQSQVLFTIYPNPTNEFIDIQTEDIFDKIEVIDITGRTIFISTITRISTKSLSNGIYFLKLNTRSGQIGINKFIKQ